MNSHARKLLIAIVWIGLLVTRAQGAAENPRGLQLIASANGGVWTEFRVEQGHIVLLENGATRPLPPDVVWSLRGDLKQSRGLVLFSPAYGIHVCPTAHGPAWLASIATFRSQLPQTSKQNLIVVYAWILEGRPVLVAPVPADPTYEAVAAEEAVTLDQRTKNGIPVALLLSSDGFVAWPSHFADPLAQRAVELMHFGTTQEIREALDQLKSVDVADEQGSTLLHIAAEAGLTEIVRVLLAKGARRDLQTRTRASPIDWVAPNGRHETLSVLLNDERSRATIKPALFSQAFLSGHVDTALALLSITPSMSAPAVGGLVATAALQNRIDALEKIAVRKDRRHFSDVPGMVLAKLIRWRYDDALLLLLANGSKPEQSVAGTPLLLFAAEVGNEPALTALLRAGAKPNAIDEAGRTALMLAATREKPSGVPLLLKAGADVDARDKEGGTALHFASRRGNEEAVALLLQAGASPGVRDKKKLSPLDVALVSRADGCATRLFRAGARLDPKHPAFRDFLVHALSLDSVEILDAAITDGWNPNQPLFESFTARQVAEIAAARNCAQHLDARNVGSKLSLESKPDSLPRPVKGGRPSDPRPWADHLPHASIKVSGLVDERGRFLFPQFAGATDALFATAILNSVQTWQFEPARKDKRPVASELTLSIDFPARFGRVFSSDDVDIRPQIKTRAKLVAGTKMKRGVVISTEERVAFAMDPNGNPRPTAINEYYRYETIPVAEEKRTGNWAAFGFIVEQNGVPSEVELLGASEGNFGKLAIEALEQYRFLPARIKNQPVRCRIVLVLHPDAT